MASQKRNIRRHIRLIMRIIKNKSDIKLPQPTRMHMSVGHLEKLIGKEIEDNREGADVIPALYKITGVTAIKNRRTFGKDLYEIDAIEYSTNRGYNVKIPWLMVLMLVEGGCAQDAQGFTMFTQEYLKKQGYEGSL